MFCTSGVTAIFQPRYSTQTQDESVVARLELNIKSETQAFSNFSKFSNNKKQNTLFEGPMEDPLCQIISLVKYRRKSTTKKP